MNKVGMIISGGTIDTAFTLEQIEKIKPEVIIGVDAGLAFLYENQIMPTHVVGDFDSASSEIVEHYRQKPGVLVRQFNPIKDASDTEMAVKLAIELEVDQLWILGGTGTRLDHVWANVQVLKIAHDAGVKAYILDVNNRISLIEKEVRLTKGNAYGTYFSVFPLGGTVLHFTIEGAKYPLHDHTLSPYDSLCVSNEIAEEEVRITFPKGNVVLMETRDTK